MNEDLFNPVPLVLYPSEAKLLSQYLQQLGLNAIEAALYAPPSHFVLYDWYRKTFAAWAMRTMKRHPQKTYTVTGLPVGIAILLMWELRQDSSTHILLINVKNELCKLLMNRNLINFNE